MNKKLLLPVGVVVLIIGIGVLYAAQANAGPLSEIARKATNAQAAAKAISENNQSYTLWYTIGMFCSGLGIALSVGGFIVGFIKKD